MLRRAHAIALLALFCVCLLPSAEAQDKKGPRSSWVAGVEYDGASISVDLPDDQQMKNIGSKIDKKGMCVFSSIEMAARYQGLEDMRGWRDWCAQKYRGGGWPEKVDKLLDAWWTQKGIKPIPYLQYEGKSPEELMRVIDRTNRMACITYGYSPRYGQGYIAHMVNGVLYGDRYGVALDNNFIRTYEWMPAPELVRRMRLSPGGKEGSAWVFVWLTPGAPPPPKAKR